MTEDGEKIVLRLIRGFGRFLCPAQFLLVFLVAVMSMFTPLIRTASPLSS